MINRTLIRTKVVQNLFSIFQQGDVTVLTAEKNLFKSCAETYDLYCVLLQMVGQITNLSTDRTEAIKHKFFASKEERNPRMQFVNNRFAEQLFQNAALRKYCDENKEVNLFWDTHEHELDQLYQEIRDSEPYQEYMELHTTTYEDDKAVWRRLFQKVLPASPTLLKLLESESLFWYSDAEIVMSFIIKTIKKFSEENGADQPLLPLFDSDDDEAFAKKLMREAMQQSDALQELIQPHLKNWNIDRLATMDLVILVTAMAEIISFPQIPVEVSMNEYIELAREYSTERSPKFINGILDELCRQLRSEGKLLKAVVIK